MKKGMMFAVGLFSILALRAESEVKQAAKSARIVQYTVTIHREESYDADRWDSVMDHALQVVRRGGSDDVEALMEAVSQSVKHMYRSTDADGIHGKISVAFGDGECPEGVCGADCRCKAKYNGVCPCGLENNRSCKMKDDSRSGCCCTRKSECGKGKCDPRCTAPCSREEKAE